MAGRDELSLLCHEAYAVIISRKKASNSRNIWPEATARMHQMTMPNRGC